MKTYLMYDELAHLWPLISPREEYAKEAGYWRDALRKKLGSGRHRILELGVGGGHNLSYLTEDFQATAVDLSEKMLKNSIRLNPDVEHHVGDMRSVRLGKKFKAVLIHDAITYMLTEDDIRKTLATAAAHLEPGGVLIMAPDDFRETFEGTSVSHSTHSDGKTELTCVEYGHDPDPGDTTTECIFLYFIREGGEVRIEQDRHVTGLFSLETWLGLMREAGFDAETTPYDVHEDGREAYLLLGVFSSHGGN
jgi:SAM-dependent methyltransferase